MEIPVIHLENPNLDPKKCYSCGKVFRTAAYLLEHKKRKTPCLIREVPPDQINNPNRCIFCNKIFSKKENLTKHLKSCKIKNGGMEILVDKVKYEQEIRILKEQSARQQILLEQEQQKNKKLEEKFAEQDQALVHVLKRLDKMENGSQIVVAAPNINANDNNTVIEKTINNTQINNQQINNQQIHYHINNYDSPNIDGLIFSLDEIAKSGKLMELSVKQIYFNPDRPENHSIYISNKKEKDIVAFHNGWSHYQGDKAQEVAITAVKKASDVSMNNCMYYEYAGMKDFLASPRSTQEVIREFTRSVNDIDPDLLEIERHPIDGFYHIAISNREIVIGTIKASGCKLIK